jgi:beta-mannosidase
VHQKAVDGNLKLERALGDHLPHWGAIDGVAGLDDWHWVTQLNQARGVAFGISHFRSLFPLNRGAVVWQLNDCWPVISWAAVDSRGIRKPLWHALRRVYADRFVTVQPRSIDRVMLHNDTDEAWQASMVVTRRGTGAGSPVLATQERQLTVAARSLGTLPLEPEVRTPGEPGGELVVVHVDGVPVAFGYFVEDPVLTVLAPAEAYDVQATEIGPATEVTVTAHALVKDLTLFPDRLDPAARVDTALVSLLAGDSHTFVVTGASGLDPDALTRRPVLRSVNDLIGVVGATQG